MICSIIFSNSPIATPFFMDPEREFAAGNLDPLRVRLRPARACQSGEANRCSLFLHCTLTSHITLFFLYLFKVGDLQVPCDSSRAEWWGFGTPKNRKIAPSPFGRVVLKTFFFHVFLKTANFQ